MRRIDRAGRDMTRLSEVALGLMAAVCLFASTAWAGDLAEDIQAAVNAAQLKGARVGISVRYSDTSESIYALNDDSQMIPASNMKVLTTGAALHALGPTFDFQTRLLRDGDRLIVVGSGDPGFGDPELLALMNVGQRRGMDVEEFLDLWVKAVIATGMTRVREVIVDDRIFDREFVHRDWPVDQLNRRYCAQVSGFNFHLNVLHFFPKPNKNGRPLLSDVKPLAPWILPSNKGTSLFGQSDKNDAWFARELGTNNLTLRGNVRFAYTAPVPVTFHDPATFFARVLADRLTAAGVTVGVARAAEASDPPPKGTIIEPVIRTPITTVVLRCNRDSENLYAEALLKRIGASFTEQPGSWSNGGALLRHVLHERLNQPSLTSRVVVADGSGLSRENRVSAGLLTAWMDSFHRDRKLGSIFIESLAIGGESGTLGSRFKAEDLRGAVVQAKSGYINGVSCLSGFVTGRDGQRRSFSVLVNGVTDQGLLGRARKLQEKIVVEIAEDLAVSVTRGELKRP